MNDSAVATATYVINGAKEAVVAVKKYQHLYSVFRGTYSSKQKVKLSLQPVSYHQIYN